MSLSKNFGLFSHDEEIQEQPPSLVDVFEMIRKLHLLASTRQPEFHLLILDLKSKLTDVYGDSKTNKQSSITEFFKIGNKSRQKRHQMIRIKYSTLLNV